MMALCWMAWAWAAVGPEPPEPPPEGLFFRVEDPTFPGALATSHDGAVLDAPPPAGTPYSVEPLPHIDGWVDEVLLDVVGAPSWHAEGFRGQGVKVAIFDLQWGESTVDPSVLGDRVQTHDCWTHASCMVPMDPVVTRFGYEEGQHGYACAEAIHEIAPDAELHLVRVNGFTTLQNAVRWAVAHDIDVISMSMSFFNSSFYDGTGPFARVMEEAQAAGILFATSAGNYANQHWVGSYVDADADGRMDLEGNNRLEVQLNGGRRTLYVNWNEFRSCGRSDLNAYLVGEDGTRYGASEDVQSPTADRCSPTERLVATVPRNGRYYLEVEGERVGATGLEVDVYVTSGAITRSMPEQSMPDPGVHPYAFTVGAVRADGYLTNNIESFSSQGPVRAPLFKPDIAGPDGLSGEAYGAVGFYGTSAATPSVAGVAALVLSRYPDMTPLEAGQYLKGWAWTDSTRTDDPRWGAGKVRLPQLGSEGRGCAASPWAPLGVGVWVWALALVRRRDD